MDGSAAAFVDAIDEVGIRELSEPRKFIKVLKPVRVEEGDCWGELDAASRLPSRRRDRFPHPVDRPPAPGTRNEPRRVPPRNVPRPHIRLHERRREALEGRAWRSAPTHNTVAIGEGKIMNREGLRYPQEFVRHKMLDAVGDLALAGAPDPRRLQLGIRAAIASTPWSCRHCSPTRATGRWSRRPACASTVRRFRWAYVRRLQQPSDTAFQSSRQGLRNRVHCAPSLPLPKCRHIPRLACPSWGSPFISTCCSGVLAYASQHVRAKKTVKCLYRVPARKALYVGRCTLGAVRWAQYEGTTGTAPSAGRCR